MSRDSSSFQTFGEALRAARQAQHKSIDEIADRTRINRRYIEAIEAGDLSQLPSGPYTNAFLREYARAVGCVVPAELTNISNTSQISSDVSIKTKLPSRDRSASSPSQSPSAFRVAPSRKPVPPVDRTTPEKQEPNSVEQLGSAAVEQIGAAFRATKELPKIANQAARSAAKTAARTTGTVIKRVESGAKDAVDAITSKSLWEEAEQVRRERRGLPPNEQNTARVGGDDVFDPRDIRSSQSTTTESIVAPSTPFPAAQAAAQPARQRFSDEASDPEPALASDTRRGGLLSLTNIVIGLIVILFAVVLAFALKLNKSESSVATEEHASTKPTTTAPAQTAKPQPASPSAAAIDSLRLSLRASQPVWISIASDGAAAGFKGELKAGDTKQFAAAQKFVVNLGNQHALDLTFNGQPLSHLPTIPNSGVVVRDLILTRDRVSIGNQSIPTSSAVAGGTHSATTSTPSGTPPLTPPSTATTHTNTPSAVKGTHPAQRDTSKTKRPTKSKGQSKRPVRNTIPPVDPMPVHP